MIHDHTPCIVESCHADGQGTLQGGGRCRCRGCGGPVGCMADWASTDPEDLEPYAEYLSNMGIDQTTSRPD